MPIARQDLQLSHGLWGFEDDPGGCELPPVHQIKKTQIAKQEWKRLIDIQRHLVLTQSRESHSSSSSDKEPLRNISHHRRGAVGESKRNDKDKSIGKTPDDKDKSKRRRVQVKTSTGSRLPLNRNRKPSTAVVAEEAKLNRKTSVSLPIVIRDKTNWTGHSLNRKSSTAPELGAVKVPAENVVHSDTNTIKGDASPGKAKHIGHPENGIRGEQSLVLHYLDTPRPPTILHIVDSGFTSSGSENEKRTMLRSAEMMETLNILLQRRFQDNNQASQSDNLSGSSARSTPIPQEYISNLNEKKLQLLNRLQYSLRALMHDRCVLIIKREALTRLEISAKLLDHIRRLVVEQHAEMKRLMDSGPKSVSVDEVRRLVMADGEHSEDQNEEDSKKSRRQEKTLLEESARLPRILELLNEVSIASHWLRRYIRQMVESFHTMIPSSVDPLLLSTHRQLNQSSEVAFTFVSAALHSKLRLLARLDPSDIDQDLLQAMFAQCQIFNKILEFSGVQTHSVKPLKVADVMERLGREQGRLAAVRAMAGVCRTARTRVEAVAGKDDSGNKVSLRENLEFEWIPGDTGSADRPEPLRKDREALAGETSDYFSDYSNGTNNGALKIYSADVGPSNNNGSITNVPATGKKNKNGTPSLCAAVDSAVGSAQSLLIRSNFVATAMSVHEAEPGTHARHGQGTGKRQRWFKPTAEHAMYTSIMQTIATVFWEAYWSSFAVRALESVVVPIASPANIASGTNPLFSLLGVDVHVKTVVLSLVDYAKDIHAPDLDEDALNAIMKIYQEIYFLVATSCWRKDMSLATISYALRRSKFVPIAGGRVGTDAGRHLFRALEPLLGYLVSCPQDNARSHNVVHQVIVRQSVTDTLQLAIQWLEDRQMFSSSWDPYQYLVMGCSDLARMRYLLVRCNMSQASAASTAVTLNTALRKESFLSRRLPPSHFANWVFVKDVDRRYQQTVTFFMSLEQIQLRQYEANCKMMCAEYFATNLPPNKYFRRKKIEAGHEIDYMTPLLQYLVVPTMKAVENYSELVQEEVMKFCSTSLVDAWKNAIQNKMLMFSYVGASQLHADISKTKHLITESCLSRRAKEACIPVFNNFAAIAAFLMEEPRLVEGAHEGLNVGLRLSHSSRSNRIAPTKSAQPIAYDPPGLEDSQQATAVVDRRRWAKHKLKPMNLCFC